MGALLAGVVIALVVYLATGGHVIFLPLFFLLPLGLFALGGRRRRTRGWRRFP
jgi:uncharacterized membrane protein YccC